jgi:cytochrome c553
MKILKTTILLGALATAGGLVASAVVGGEVPPRPAEAELAKVDSEAVWRASCASCHGRDGKGETRAGRRAGVKDLVDATYQESFSDEEAFKAVKFGMVKNGTELMKPFKDELTDVEIHALIVHLRKFDPKHPRDLSEAALKKTK